MNLILHRSSLAAIAILFASTSWGYDQRLKVEGTWDGDIFHITRVKQRDPGKDVRRIRVSGTVSEFSAEDRFMRIGPVRLTWNPTQDETFSSLRPGDTLQVDAIQSAMDTFFISQLEPERLETNDSVELIGALTGYENNEKWTDLRLAGIAARVPRHLFRNARMRSRRLDDSRPESQYSFAIGNVVTTLGGELELNSDAVFERDLDEDNEDREVDIEQQVQIEAFVDISENISAFGELKYERSARYQVPWERIRSESELERGAMWVYVNQPFGLPIGVQVGRQNFAEVREWWWDTDLDALRIDARIKGLALEVAVAEELGRENLSADHADPEDADIFRILARGTMRFSSAFLVDLFYVHQNDHSPGFVLGQTLAATREDEDDATLAWVGARLSGNIGLFRSAEMDYWIDVASVEGDEVHYEFDDFGDDDIEVVSVVNQVRSGSSVDAGATIKWSDMRWGPVTEMAISLGYAAGSGADSSDGTFVPTGLNDNNGKFNGVNRFRYYGELTRPELSNLRITTLALGLRIGEDSSIELVHHNYRQPHKSIRHPLRIDADANARFADLGNEIDIVLGIRIWKHWEIETVFSHFIPGSGFDNGDSASGLSLELNFNF